MSGTVFALAAYVLWGVLPAYWKALGHVSTPDVLAHRVLWSLAFTLLVVFALRRRPSSRRCCAIAGSAWRSWRAAPDRRELGSSSGRSRSIAWSRRASATT
jgi:EamA domain-containing membrane protein RarD